MANIKNLANGIVLTPPSGTTGTTLVLESGYGAIMPATPFFLTCTPPGQLSTMGNSEIIQVTARSTDTLTIVRAQKSTTARTMVAGWVVGNGNYADDIIGATGNTVVKQTPTGLINGSNTVFTTLTPYIGGTLLVYRNGSNEGNLVTETSPSAGTFTIDAPSVGDDIQVGYSSAATGSGNADTIDNFHASVTPTAGMILPLNASAQIASSVIDFSTSSLIKSSASTSVNTASTTPVDIGNMTQPTITVPSSGKVIIMGTIFLLLLNTTAADLYCRVLIGSTASRTFSLRPVGQYHGANLGIFDVMTGLTPGTATAKVQYWSVSSSSTVQSQPDYNSVLVLPIGA